MRDYTYTGNVKVADMDTAEIIDVLRDGIEATDTVPETAIRDRLNLELFIRSRGLRLANNC